MRTWTAGLLALPLATALAVSALISDPESSAAEIFNPVARAGLVASTSLVLGLNLIPSLPGAPYPPPAIARRIRTWGTAASAGGLACALLVLATSVTKIDPRGLTPDSLISYVTTFTSGKALVGAAALTLSYIVVEAVRGPEKSGPPGTLGIMIALAAMVPTSLSGHVAHATYEFADVMVLGMIAHVFGAMCWVGGLAAIGVVGARDGDYLRKILPGFSVVAGVSSIAVLASGLLDGALVLISQPAGFAVLFQENYGRVLLAKTVALGLLLILGGRMRFVVITRIGEGRTASPLRWVLLELALMGVVFGLASVLSTNPPTG